MSSQIANNVEAITLTVAGHVITDFIAGDIITLEFPNENSSHIVASNGGVNIQRRVDRDVCNLKFNVQKRSSDDIYMNTILNSPTLRVIDGSLKIPYTNNGVDGVDTYTLQGGSITVRPNHTENDQDGNSSSEYTIRFRSARRNI